MHWPFFVFPPAVGIAVVVLGLRWALKEHRQDRRRWTQLLERTTSDSSAFQVIEGEVVAHEALDAPFSGRTCAAYRADLIGRTHHMNEYTYRRLAAETVGAFEVKTADGRTIEVDFDGAQVILPPDLVGSENLSASVRAYSGGGDRAPDRVQAWASELSDEALWNEYFNPTRDKIFKAAQVVCLEHRLEQGQQVVLAGDVTVSEGGQLTIMAGPEGLFFGSGSLASERKRIATLPVASELFGAVMGGVIAAALTGGLLAAFLPKDTPAESPPVEHSAP
jgi:hypothetical protein